MVDRLRDSTRRTGFSIMDHAVLDDVKAFGDVYEKLIYILLLRHADSKSGACFPSYETLAEKAMCSRRKAVNAVKALADRGLILIERNVGRSNVYTVKDDVLLGGGSRSEECTACTGSDDIPDQGSAPCAPGGCTTCTRGVHAVHPNYIHRTISKELYPPISPDGGSGEGSPSGKTILEDESAGNDIPEPEQTTLLAAPEPALEERDRGTYDVVRERFAIGEGEFAGLLELWRKTYAGVDVGAEIRRAIAWLAENRREYRSAAKFLGNWLRRAKPKPGASADGFEAKAREMFAVFWEAYPKRDGERAAFEAFVAIFAPLAREARNAAWKNLESHLAVLLDRIERGEISEERYVPLAKNWLRGIDATKQPEHVPLVERWAEASGDA